MPWQQIAEWSNGVHNSSDIGKIVKCEVCHGAGGERDDLGPFKAAATGADHQKISKWSSRPTRESFARFAMKE